MCDFQVLVGAHANTYMQIVWKFVEVNGNWWELAEVNTKRLEVPIAYMAPTTPVEASTTSMGSYIYFHGEK